MSDPTLFDYDDPFADEQQVFVTQMDEDTKVVVERELIKRQRAYRRFMLGRASAQDVEIVQLDLAKFCRAFETTHAATERDTALLNGRREVFMRIFDFTQLELAQLYAKYQGR